MVWVESRLDTIEREPYDLDQLDELLNVPGNTGNLGRGILDIRGNQLRGRQQNLEPSGYTTSIQTARRAQLWIPAEVRTSHSRRSAMRSTISAIIVMDTAALLTESELDHISQSVSRRTELEKQLVLNGFAKAYPRSDQGPGLHSSVAELLLIQPYVKDGRWVGVDERWKAPEIGSILVVNRSRGSTLKINLLRTMVRLIQEIVVPMLTDERAMRRGGPGEIKDAIKAAGRHYFSGIDTSVVV
ncbi:hypothetical protein MRB53_038321 [Persea americana]|nr:hypothetical protein MRB53_038321 [Persea americana]